MTTWTLQQVSQATRLWAWLVVDDSLLHRDPDAVQQKAIDELGKQLIQMGHPFGIELNPEDFEVQWIRSPANPWGMTGEMRWRPKVSTAELRGGHLDGQRWALQQVGQALRVPRPASTPWFTDDDETAEAALTEMVDVYKLAGWREDERVWVYAAT